jgi:hypothetical protein
VGSPATFDFPLNGPVSHVKACQIVKQNFQASTDESLRTGRWSGLSMMRNYLLQFQAYLDGASGFYKGLEKDELTGVVNDLHKMRDDLRKPIQDTVIAVFNHSERIAAPKPLGEMPAEGNISWGSRFAWDIINKLAGNFLPNYHPEVDTSTCLYRHDEMFSPRIDVQETTTQGSIDFNIPIRQAPIPERAQRIFFHLEWDSEKDVLPRLSVFGGFEGVHPLREEELKIEKRDVPLNNVGAEAVKSAKDILAKIYNV